MVSVSTHRFGDPSLTQVFKIPPLTESENEEEEFRTGKKKTRFERRKSVFRKGGQAAFH